MLLTIIGAQQVNFDTILAFPREKIQTTQVMLSQVENRSFNTGSYKNDKVCKLS